MTLGQPCQTILRQSWDGEYFADNAVRNTDGRLEVTRNSTETCQYYAFYFKNATPEAQPQLWQRLINDFGPSRMETKLHPEIPPSNAFIGNVLRMELLSRTGLTEQLLRESRDYWLYMAERTGTLWEHTDLRASLNHGFTSHVINVLYRDVLGLFLVDSVTRQVELRFTDSSVDWCQGRVPVCDGVVSLRWTRDHGTLTYKLVAPAGYKVSIVNSGHDQIRTEEEAYNE